MRIYRLQARRIFHTIPVYLVQHNGSFAVSGKRANHSGFRGRGEQHGQWLHGREYFLILWYSSWIVLIPSFSRQGLSSGPQMYHLHRRNLPFSAANFCNGWHASHVKIKILRTSEGSARTTLSLARPISVPLDSFSSKHVSGSRQVLILSWCTFLCYFPLTRFLRCMFTLFRARNNENKKHN